MATIKEVADYAGVSVATVSRVLNQTGYVSDDLRQRVQEAAARLQYRPSRVAKSLRRQKTETVGVLVPQLDQPFFSKLTFAIQQRLLGDGYYTLVGSSIEDSEAEAAYIEMLVGQRVDGVVIVPTGTNSGNVERLLNYDIPVVMVDRDIPQLTDLDRVMCDNQGGAFTATQHLLELGHRRISFIGGPAYSEPVKARQRGVEAALKTHGMALSPDQFITGQLPQFEMGYTAARDLLRQSPRPTAIFAFSDVTAIGAIHAANELGIRIPEDISIIGFDNIPMAAYTYPELTTVSQPIQAMGRAAGDLLMKRIQGDTSSVQRITLETALVIRKSTAEPGN